ncbi:MAG TPA: hypothetical protein VMF61_14600 [Candidatus Acidoferrales bacterium]|nr:hypothetical protein [Candidatus Acidoferrales bacterium]
MDSLAALREKIPSFPGYREEGDRRLSGELVRSYLGEALADLRDRLEPLPPELETSIDDAIVNVGFVNQQTWHVFEDAARTVTSFDALAAADEDVLRVAGDAAAVDVRSLAAYLDEVAATLDRRDATLRGYAAPASSN